MPTLSSLLVQRGVSSMQAVEDAIARQVIYGDDLATNVLEVGAAREDDVTRLAAESMAMFPLPTGKITLLDAQVLRLLTGDVAARYGIFPIEKRGADLVVATSEPLSQNVEEDLGFLLNLNLRPVYALHVRIVQALAEHYGQPVERRYTRLLEKLEGRRRSGTEPPPGQTPVRTESSFPTLPEAAKSDAPPPMVRAHTIPMGFVAPPSSGPAMVPITPRTETLRGGVATKAGEAAAASVPPDRPTLRGLPAVVPDEPRGPAPDHAASGLPATIDLSPRPPVAAKSELPEIEAVPEPARAASGSRPPVDAVRAPSAPPVAEAPSPAPIPAALQARPAPRDARPSPARARRKGPFPASLAEEEMQSAVTTDGVLEVFFDFAQQYFEYAALFVVHGDIAEGRDGAGRGADRARVSTVGIPLDLPSTLASARDRKVPIVSDLAHEGLDAELLTDLGRAVAIEGAPASPTAPSHRAPAAVVPIVVRGRAVALLFGDDAPAPVELTSIGDVIAFAALAGASIERIILRKKMGRSGAASPGAAPRLSPAAVAAVAPRVENPAPATSVKSRPAEAPRFPARPGVAALARMFSPAPIAAPQRLAKPKDLDVAPEAALEAPAPPEAAPEAPAPADDASLAAPVIVAPIAAPEVRTDLVAEPREPEVAPLVEPFIESPSGGESIAIALETPSISDDVTVVPVESVVRREPVDSWSLDASVIPQHASPELPEPSSDALTVALLVHESTPLPFGATPSPFGEARSNENETQAIPDAELETVEPGDVALLGSVEAEPSAAGSIEPSVPLDVDFATSAPAEVEPSVPIDLATSTPNPVDSAVFSNEAPPPDHVAEAPAKEPPRLPDMASNLETIAAALTDRRSVSADRASAAAAAALIATPTPSERLSATGDRPSSFDRPASSDGRPSGPLIVDVFADSTDGLASAIARAAEEANARAAARSSAAADPTSAPPEPRAESFPSAVSNSPETLTEGFPAVAPTSAHLTLGAPGEAAAPLVEEAHAEVEEPPAEVEEPHAEHASEASSASPLVDDDASELTAITEAPSSFAEDEEPDASELTAITAAIGDFSDEAPQAAPPEPAPIVAPPPPEPDTPWTRMSLDTLLQRAARGAEIADARAELLRRAERNLAPLLALFPGPLEQDRHRSSDRLPPASQCGPLLLAFAHAGARGAATVSVLARHEDVDVRFWAAHLLGEIESPESADGLLAFLVDPDAAVRRIAFRSAGLLLAASLPGRPLEAALGHLARDAQTPMRERIAAIDAMGQLRLPFFVPVLIGLLGAVPDEVGESARRALLVLTRQDFARDAARWAEWWSRNDARHRLEWLIDALMHDTQSIRRAAGDELKSLTKEYFGYYDDLPRRERERAQERYREWWERDGRGRFT